MNNRFPLLAEKSGVLAPGTLVDSAIPLPEGGGFYQDVVATSTGLVQYFPNLSPTSVSSGAGYEEQFFTVTGLTLKDTVCVNPPVMAAPPHCQLIAWRVSAVDTLALTFHAVSGTEPPPQGVYRVLAFRGP